MQKRAVPLLMRQQISSVFASVPHVSAVYAWAYREDSLVQVVLITKEQQDDAALLDAESTIDSLFPHAVINYRVQHEPENCSEDYRMY